MNAKFAKRNTVRIKKGAANGAVLRCDLRVLGVRTFSYAFSTVTCAL